MPDDVSTPSVSVWSGRVSQLCRDCRACVVATLCAAVLCIALPAKAAPEGKVETNVTPPNVDYESRLFYPFGSNGPARRIYYSLDQGFEKESFEAAGLWKYLTPARIVHPQELWRDPATDAATGSWHDLPPREQVVNIARQHRAESVERGDGMTVLNIEHWHVNTLMVPGLTRQTAALNAVKLRAVMDWYRSGWPGQQLGYFSIVPGAFGDSYDPDTNWRAKQTIANVHQHGNMLYMPPSSPDYDRGLLDAVDAVHMVAYPTWERYGDPTDGEIKWIGRAVALASLARMVDKPAYLWINLNYLGGDFVESQFVYLQLYMGLRLFDGVVIWGGTDCQNLFSDENDPPGCPIEYRPGTERAAWFERAVMTISREFSGE